MKEQYPTLEQHSTAIATLSEVGEVARREIPYRKMVELACRRAITLAFFTLPLPPESNAGIAFFTVQGERYPETWRVIKAGGGRIKPTQFESIIHNSAPGYAAIQLGLTGPQIVLVEGNIRLAAELQLLSGRSKLMLVCKAELEGPASCYVLEKVS